jgi:osmoprotectant transport system permease protein
VTTPIEPAASAAAVVTPRIGVHDPVLLALIIAAAAAALGSGFVAVAPNRLVSGMPMALWASAGPGFTVSLAFLGGLLLALSLSPPRLVVARVAAVVAGASLLLTVAALGAAARALAVAAPAATRVSAGPAFWIIAGCAALALVGALQRLCAGPALMAAAFAAVGGGIALLVFLGSGFDALSIAREYATRRPLFAAALTRHIVLVAASVGPALLIGVPVGIAAVRRQSLQGPIFAVLNLLQTVPSIALFGLLIVPLSALAGAVPLLAALGVGGIGPAPAIIALILYALLPIVRNTVSGIAGVDPGVIDAARGVGLTQRQIFWRVELPLSLPILVAGLRIVIVQTIGLAVVAALIGAGGLGTFVFEGLGQYALDLVLLGALPAIGLALAADLGLHLVSALLPRAAPA